MKNRMKTPVHLRLLLLLALVCVLAGTGELSTTTGVAHAASSQLHITHHAAIADVCDAGMAEMDDEFLGVICYNSVWGLIPEYITSLNTGNHTLTLYWRDCKKGIHGPSVWGPGTIVEQGHGLTNGWAGCASMDPLSIELSNAAAYSPGTTCPYGMAEMDDLQHGVGCFLNHLAPAVTYVHIVNSGPYHATWSWKDCKSGSHVMGTKPPGYYLVVNNPPAPGCTSSMDYVYDIDFF